jgi:hypothetical protein
VPNRDSRLWLPVVQNQLCNLGVLHHCMHIMLGTCVPNLTGRWWVEHTQIHPALRKGTKTFRSRCTINLEKIKFRKKQNLQIPWGLEDLILPSILARSKKCGCYTHTPKEAQALQHARAFKKNLKFKKATPCLYRQRPAVSRLRPIVADHSNTCPPVIVPLPPSFLHPAPKILHMWSILSHCRPL